MNKAFFGGYNKVTILEQYFTDRMAEMGLANIEKFGPTGDNIDCQPAIQNALLKGRGCIVIPPETYGIGTMITLPNYAIIRGNATKDYYTFGVGGAKGNCKLKALAGMTSNTPILNVVGKAGVKIHDLMIDGAGDDGRTSQVMGISGGSTNMTLNAVYVVSCNHGLGGFGVTTYGGNTTILSAIDSTFENCTNDGISNLVDSSCVHCGFSGNKRNGVQLVGVASNVFIDCRVEWNEKHGYDIYGCDSLQWVSGIIDANKGDAVRVDSGDPGFSGRFQFTGVHFRRNARLDTYDFDECHMSLLSQANNPLTQVVINGCIFSHGRDDVGAGVDSPDERVIRTRSTINNLLITGNAFSIVSGSKIMTVDTSPTASRIDGNLVLPDMALGGTMITYP